MQDGSTDISWWHQTTTSALECNRNDYKIIYLLYLILVSSFPQTLYFRQPSTFSAYIKHSRPLHPSRAGIVIGRASKIICASIEHGFEVFTPRCRLPALKCSSRHHPAMQLPHLRRATNLISCQPHHPPHERLHTAGITPAL